MKLTAGHFAALPDYPVHASIQRCTADWNALAPNIAAPLSQLAVLWFNLNNFSSANMAVMAPYLLNIQELCVGKHQPIQETTASTTKGRW